jgi:hypothetical protein
MTDVEKAAEAAKKATARETFDFAAAVLDRSYPEFDVPVYLNERSIQRMLEVTKERSDLELRIAKTKNPKIEQAKRLEALDEEYEKVVESLRGERYMVKIKGISPEEQLALEEKAFEAFPREYDTAVNPITNVPVRTEIGNSKRDELFATLLRQAHLVSVTAPDGAVDTNFEDTEKVRKLFARLPYVARAKVDEAINEATIAVDFYRELVDEVF